LPDVIENLDQCPKELTRFIKRIEEVSGVKISLVSHGPDRNQTFKI
jgi:adenylosuccinate synthase